MDSTNQPKWHSYSRLSVGEKCGIKYALKYIERVQVAGDTPKTIRGSGVHHARDVFLSRRMEIGDDLTRDEVCEVARDEVVARFTRELRLTDEEKASGKEATRGHAVDVAVALTGLDYDNKLTTIRPVAVEHRLEAHPNGLHSPIIAYADVIDEAPLLTEDHDALGKAGLVAQPGRHVILDCKTGKRSPKNTEHTSIQLTLEAMLYEYMYEEPIVAVGIDNLIANKTPLAERRLSTRLGKDMPLLRRFARLEEVIEKGAFTPAPTDAWWCSASHCEYWNMCPYASRPVSVGTNGKDGQ